jgi:hypothetical protein
MLASFSGIWFLHSEKDIGIGTPFLILRFRAQTHMAKWISNCQLLYVQVTYKFSLSKLSACSLHSLTPPTSLYYANNTYSLFKLIPLLPSSYNPFPSLLLSTHYSLFSLIFLCTFIVHIPTLVLFSLMLYILCISQFF